MEIPSSRKKVFAIAAVVLFAAAAAVAFFLSRDGKDDGTIRVSGNIEVTDVDVSFRIPGRVAQRAVDEGMAVSAGQLVARLDSADLEREVSLREAELQAAEATLSELVRGSRPQEIARARAADTAARAEAERLSLEYERVKALHARDSVSRQELERARAAFMIADQRSNEANETLRLVEEGPRKERIEQARAGVRRGKEALELARTRFSYATVASPLTGIVLSKNAEPGAYVAAGTPVVTVGDLADVWLRAYIEETDLGRVKVGQPVDVTADTYPGKTYQGRISFISSQAEFTPKSVQTRKERARLVYRIKVAVANPSMELKPGMPADGAIRLR